MQVVVSKNNDSNQKIDEIKPISIESHLKKTIEKVIENKLK